MHTIEWWLERLQNVRSVGDGYTALCPAHEDRQNSLSIRGLPDGGILVNCFKGCRYSDIEQKLEEGPVIQVALRSVSDKRTARETWEEYTQIPSGFWEELGVSYQQDFVVFSWEDIETIKRRNVLTQTRSFDWLPQGTPRPPLWPTIPLDLPSDVWITEGESDCGVLRYLGLLAFALTKGANSLDSNPLIWKALKDRGAKRVILVMDQDAPGQKDVPVTLKQILSQGLEVCLVQLGEVINPLLGEKDVRDLWLRYKNVHNLKVDLEKNLVSPIETKASWMSVTDFLTSKFTEQRWIVQNILSSETVSLIVGSPKTHKTWLALDLASSVATGASFLGHFVVERPGPVVYISKEDPDYALQDRLGKIFTAKGLGGKAIREPGRFKIQLPGPQLIPFYLDLTRGFLFDPAQMNELLAFLATLKSYYGGVSLVVFDPILRMIGQGLDEFKASEVSQAIFEPALRLVRELNTSVLLVHHRNKGGSTGKGSYGSVGFHAFADSTMFIQGDEPDQDGWFGVHSEAKSSREHDWSYRMKELEPGYVVEVQSQIRNPQTIVLADLSKLLRNNPSGMTVDAIEKYFFDVDTYLIRNILKTLERQNLARREKEAVSPGMRGGRKKDLWFWSGPGVNGHGTTS